MASAVRPLFFDRTPDMTGKTMRFFSSVAARAADGSVAIGLFDGTGVTVALLACSEDAALSLIANIAACLRNGDVSQGGDGA